MRVTSAQQREASGAWQNQCEDYIQDCAATSNQKLSTGRVPALLVALGYFRAGVTGSHAP